MSQEKERIDDGGPVFPVPNPYFTKGMSLRAYAAIKLRVPESGIDWLDGMIRQSKREEFAGQVLMGLMAESVQVAEASTKVYAAASYAMADAMIAARKEGAK